MPKLSLAGLAIACFACFGLGKEAEEAVHADVLLYGGFEYRTLMPGVAVDSTKAATPICHTGWQPVPDHYELAPDTVEVRTHIVAQHTWSTHVMVLASFKGYGTASLPSSGVEFGEYQDKVMRRTSPAGVVEYKCPWTCYQVLARRPVGPLASEPGVAAQLMVAGEVEHGLASHMREHPGMVRNLTGTVVGAMGPLAWHTHQNNSPRPQAATAPEVEPAAKPTVPPHEELGTVAPNAALPNVKPTDASLPSLAKIAGPRLPWVAPLRAMLIAATCAGLALGAFCSMVLSRREAREPLLRAETSAGPGLVNNMEVSTGMEVAALECVEQAFNTAREEADEAE